MWHAHQSACPLNICGLSENGCFDQKAHIVVVDGLPDRTDLLPVARLALPVAVALVLLVGAALVEVALVLLVGAALPKRTAQVLLQSLPTVLVGLLPSSASRIARGASFCEEGLHIAVSVNH